MREIFFCESVSSAVVQDQRREEHLDGERRHNPERAQPQEHDQRIRTVKASRHQEAAQRKELEAPMQQARNIRFLEADFEIRLRSRS